MSRLTSVSLRLLTCLALAVPLIGAFYLGSKLGWAPFAPFDFFDWLSRHLPGAFLTAAIDLLVRVITKLGLGPIDRVSKAAEQSLAIVGFLVLLVGVGFVTTILAKRFASRKWVIAAVAGLVLGAWVAVIQRGDRMISAGVLLLWTFVVVLVDSRRDRGNQRSFLGKAGTICAALTLALFAGGHLLSAQTSAGSWADVPLDQVRPTTQALKTIAASRSVRERTGLSPVPGTRSEITPNEKFYRVDINTSPPSLDVRSWSLEVAGLFTKPGKLTFRDLLQLPEATQAITLCCISNPIGGDLISSGFFTGIRLPDLLSQFGIDSRAKALKVTAADGYYETVSFADMRDSRSLLVYGLNGRTLSAAQGFPVRLYLPNRYGMKQPKWITRIEAVADPDTGYWVARGWSREARPQTLAIIDAVDPSRIENGKVPIGGIAWAGDRGIRRVEIQVDDGPWLEATLLLPQLGPLTWVLWKYDWPVVHGRHLFRARATDDSGRLQTAERQPPHPNGATGYHQVSADF